MSKRRAQTFIYKQCVPQTVGLWKDEAWVGVKKFFNALDGFNIINELTDTPRYFNFPYDSNKHVGLPYKEWYFVIKWTNDKNKPAFFNGTIRGNGAGSVDDPLDRYDVTVVVG